MASGAIASLPVTLTPLHLALDAYMANPGNLQRIAHVRHHLTLVHAATAHEALTFSWREMHEFTTILLNADQWRSPFD